MKKGENVKSKIRAIVERRLRLVRRIGLIMLLILCVLLNHIWFKRPEMVIDRYMYYKHGPERLQKIMDKIEAKEKEERLDDPFYLENFGYHAPSYALNELYDEEEKVRIAISEATTFFEEENGYEVINKKIRESIILVLSFIGMFFVTYYVIMHKNRIKKRLKNFFRSSFCPEL